MVRQNDGEKDNVTDSSSLVTHTAVFLLLYGNESDEKREGTDDDDSEDTIERIYRGLAFVSQLRK
jgi:hypothetical protein